MSRRPLSIGLKGALAGLLSSLGILSWGLRRAGAGVVILMYHRILFPEEAAGGIQEGMYVRPDTLEMHIRFLRDRFDVVSLAEAARMLEEPRVAGRGKPACVITFDDGWADFHERAFPVLKKHAVPATVFLPTDYIGSRELFWTDVLASLLAATGRRAETGSGDAPPAHPLARTLEGLAGPFPDRLEKAISLLKGRRDEEILAVMAELEERRNEAVRPPGRVFLTWDEVRDMARSGLVSFGSHTARHRILSTLSEGEIEDELRRSRERLVAEGAAAPKDIPFSYPNGNHDGKIARMVREAGFFPAVTTERGWNRQGADPYRLRRVAVHQDMASTRAMLGCRLLDII